MKISKLFAITFMFSLAACGSNSSSPAGDSQSVATAEIQTPRSVESFVLTDVPGKPRATFVEFKNKTIVTVRDSDGVRIESIRFYMNDQKWIVERSTTENWAAPYDDQKTTEVSAEWARFREYHKLNIRSQLSGCRASHLHELAVASLKRPFEPVMLSLQPRRKASSFSSEVLLELDLNNGRWAGLTLDSGSYLVKFREIFYVAVDPTWVIDGRGSSSILGTVESVELFGRCREQERLRARVTKQSDLVSDSQVDAEISKMVDSMKTPFGPFQSYNSVPRRYELRIKTFTQDLKRLKGQSNE